MGRTDAGSVESQQVWALQPYVPASWLPTHGWSEAVNERPHPSRSRFSYLYNRGNNTWQGYREVVNFCYILNASFCSDYGNSAVVRALNEAPPCADFGSRHLPKVSARQAGNSFAKFIFSGKFYGTINCNIPQLISEAI